MAVVRKLLKDLGASTVAADVDLAVGLGHLIGSTALESAAQPVDRRIAGHSVSRGTEDGARDVSKELAIKLPYTAS